MNNQHLGNNSNNPVHSLKLPAQTNDQEISDNEDKKNKRSPNDINMIKSIKQLETTELDLHSPRFQKACVSLGIPLRDCVKKRKEHFMEKGLADDIVELRLKHFQNRQIDLLNRILEERRKLKNREILHDKLQIQTNQNKTQGQSFYSPQNNHTANPNSRAAQLYGSVKSPMGKIGMTSQSHLDNKRFASTSKMQLSDSQQYHRFNSPPNLRGSFDDQWSFEQDKIQKLKSKKVFKAQMIIDLEHLKLMKDRQYESRLKEMEKKFKEEEMFRKELKDKHEMKLTSVKGKNEQIQKELEYQSRILLERAQKDMRSKQEKHDMLERQRFEELKRREEEFERKRQKIEQMKRDQEQEDLRAVETNLQQFEYKIKESQDKHAYQLQRVISEARLRNTIQSEKVNKWKEDQQRQELEELHQVYKNEEKYMKKMQKIAKSTQDLHQKIREKKLMKQEKQNHNKKVEDGEIECKLKAIMQKFKHAEENKEKEHDIALKHELRRLKEEDRKKERERQKRLDNQRKRKILKKTRETQSQIEFYKISEQELQKKRVQETVKTMIDLKNMFSTVQTVLQAKNLPIKEKSKILRDHSLEIKPQFIEKKKKKDENDLK
ncbi:UNKNOWN [Stylonychia lemnae]|uniref:Uncharacterized protein n=1 Tax=Stylonychia lemnae TaxID=5949 RepID=A0A077ZXC5_STYLE|nr:UNKNOWN [Stylonychia lemnae]|eukprot:CDW74561.1 UNKNOWN [Stylonychia lemnae]